jgi:hypothetical protein
MVTAESHSDFLRSEELRLLGGFCPNDFPVRVEQDATGVRIVPPPTPWFYLTVMTLAIAVIFGGMVGAAIYFSRNNPPRPWEWGIFAVAGVLAIFGPLLIHLKQLAYLRSISPLLSYDSATGQVSVQAGKFVTDAGDVVCLLAIAIRGSEGSATSELQLVAESHGERSYHLIAAATDGEPYRPFAKQMKEFSRRTGLRAAVAQQMGLLRDDPWKITEITPKKSAV